MGKKKWKDWNRGGEKSEEALQSRQRDCMQQEPRRMEHEEAVMIRWTETAALGFRGNIGAAQTYQRKPAYSTNLLATTYHHTRVLNKDIPGFF